MPYSGPADKSLPAHVRKASSSRRAAWVDIFNAALRDTGDEGEAMRRANAWLQKQRTRRQATAPQANIIHTSTAAYASPPWKEVDKGRLPAQAFAQRPDPKRRATWRFPHHFLAADGQLYLHEGGLTSALAAAEGRRSGKKASPKTIEHLRAHRRALAKAPPPKRPVYALDATGDDTVVKLSARRFEKELIRCGSWSHPTKGWTLTVDRPRMGRWAQAFYAMRRDGIKVPVPFGHSYDPRDNGGFLEDLRIDGDRMIGLVEIAADVDAAKIEDGRVRFVSVGIAPEFKAGNGKTYGEAIEHVALTNHPVVTQQDGFKIAADHADEVDLIALSAESASADNAPPHKGADVTLDQLKALLGLDDLTEDNAEAKLKEYRAAHEAATQQLSATANKVKTLESQVAALQAAADAGDADDGDDDLADNPKFQEMQADLIAARHDLARQRRDAVNATVDAATKEGKIAPAQKADAVLLLSATGGAVFNLDTKAQDGINTSEVFGRFLAAIPAGATLDLATRTAGARRTDNPGDDEVKQAKARAKASKTMLESRGYKVTLSADETEIINAELPAQAK